MEAFSQSRGDDDLFDDEIVPIEQPQPAPILHVTPQINKISLENSSSQANQDQTPPSSTSDIRPLNRSRGRGTRGFTTSRGSDRKGAAGLGESKFANKTVNTRSSTTTSTPSHDRRPKTSTTENPLAVQDSVQKPAAAEARTDAPSIRKHDTPEDGQESTDATANTATGAPPANAPVGPSKVPAVRGDRTATGGVRKPKLTEEELTAKLAAAKERSVELAAAHARAQADAADFEERERMASEKRQKDMANRKVLEGERERNRARKMAGFSGREWDADKREENFSRGQGRRGGPDSRYPDGHRQNDTDLRMYEWNEERSSGGPRGRRGYGRGTRGRGNREAEPNDRAQHPINNTGDGQKQLNTTAEIDFPALPGSKSNSDANTHPKAAAHLPPRPAITSINSSGSLADEGGGGGGMTGRSWAEQVESTEAAKAIIDTKP